MADFNEDINMLEDTDGGCFSGPQIDPAELVMQHLKSPVANKSDMYYNMNHEKRGLAVIFNHKKFHKSLNLKERKGTDVDCDKLESCFKKLEFDVQIWHDLEIKKLREKLGENDYFLLYLSDGFAPTSSFEDEMKILQRHIIKHRKVSVAEMDHSNSDCLVITILTHGRNNGFIYANDGAYMIDEITNDLTSKNCPTLAGKPKILFVEACQGALGDVGVYFCESDGSESSNAYKIPLNADFLIVNSSIPGYLSFRHTMNGSWFIQALTAELEQHCYEYELATLLTFANLRLAIEFESDEIRAELKGKKQIACITSMLTRLVKFSPKTTENQQEKS